MKTFFNGHSLDNMFKLCLSWYPMITSGSGIGASFGFHQSPLPLVASSHSGIGASFGFHQSPLLSVASCHYGMGAFLWISSEPSSVFLRDTLLLCKFCLNFVSTSVLVANCTLLHKLLMLNISSGCCRHSVFNTSVQLTEGRSARDKPKQLPAKKKYPMSSPAREIHSISYALMGFLK